MILPQKAFTLRCVLASIILLELIIIAAGKSCKLNYFHIWFDFLKHIFIMFWLLFIYFLKRFSVPTNVEHHTWKQQLKNDDRSGNIPSFPLEFNNELKKMKNLKNHKIFTYGGRRMMPSVTTGEIFEALQRANRNISYKLRSLMLKRRINEEKARKKKELMVSIKN